MSAKHKNREHETETEQHGAEQAVEATQESLDKVRDILFGAQIRQQDHRYQEFAEGLQKDFSAFGQETRKHLETLEAFVKREIASLLDVLKVETGARSDAAESLAAQIKDLSTTIEKRISQIDEQRINAERALRQEILEQSKTLRDELGELGQSLHAAIEKSNAELRHAKADRSALAALFSEMAQRLNA